MGRRPRDPRSRRLRPRHNSRPRDPRCRRLRPRQISGRLLLDLLLPRDPSPPIKPHRGDDVEDDKGPQDAKVAVSVPVRRADPAEVDVGFFDGAEFAIGAGVVVGEVATGGGDIGAHVFDACFARRRVELDIFDRGADGVGVGQASGEHAVDKIGEG